MSSKICKLKFKETETRSMGGNFVSTEILSLASDIYIDKFFLFLILTNKY